MRERSENLRGYAKIVRNGKEKFVVEFLSFGIKE
jgi:hypothetical protein